MDEGNGTQLFSMSGATLKRIDNYLRIMAEASLNADHIMSARSIGVLFKEISGTLTPDEQKEYKEAIEGVNALINKYDRLKNTKTIGIIKEKELAYKQMIDKLTKGELILKDFLWKKGMMMPEIEGVRTEV